MVHMVTRDDLTSTTIQIRGDDTRSNLLMFDTAWEASEGIKVVVRLHKAEDFEEMAEKLFPHQKEYLNAILTSVPFQKTKTFYLPDFAILSSGTCESLNDTLSRIVIELLTGAEADDTAMQALFTVEFIGIEMDTDFEVGFPVMD